MTSIFLDSNVWLRSILKDNHQYSDCTKLITAISLGKYQSYTSSVVLLEIDYLLTRTFKVKKKDSQIRLETLIEIPNVTIINNTQHQQAIKLYQQTNIKFADCLIATQIPKNTILITYDQEFKKIPKLTSMTPAEFLAK